MLGALRVDPVRVTDNRVPRGLHFASHIVSNARATYVVGIKLLVLRLGVEWVGPLGWKIVVVSSRVGMMIVVKCLTVRGSSVSRVGEG